MDGNKICEDITNLHGNIESVEIVEKGVPIAVYAKGSTPPNHERISIQAESFADNIRNNKQFYGRHHYIVAHNNNLDLFFFPIVVNARKMILLLSIASPYDHNEMVQKIFAFLNDSKLMRPE